MFQVPPDTLARLTALDCQWRFFIRGAEFKLGPDGKPVPDPERPARTFCEIIDRTTGKPYFHIDGDSEQDALEKASIGALTAPKPLTPAQEAQKLYQETGRLTTEIEAKDERIKQLEDELRRAKHHAGEDNTALHAPVRARREEGAKRVAAGNAAAE